MQFVHMSPTDTELGRRIKDLRDTLGEGQAAFGARFEVEQATVSRWEAGNIPKRTLWKKIAKVAKVAPAEFFFGIPEIEAPPEKTTQKKRSVVTSFDPDADGNPHDSEADPNTADFPADAIKELAAKGGMGSGQTIETSYTRDGTQIVQRDAILDDYWRLPPDFIRGDLKTSVAKLLIVRCRGDSMEPTLRAGDRVVVDTSDVKPSGDRIFAIRDQLGEIVIKRLRLVGRDPVRIQIVSDNPTVENVEDNLELVSIVGRVVAALKLL